jgi:hypothetical protein
VFRQTYCPPLLHDLYRDIVAHLHQQNLHTNIPPHGLYEIPSSYRLVSSSEMEVFLHVPILSETLEVFQLEPFPVSVGEGTAQLIHADTLLAITPDRAKFASITGVDLQLCSVMDAAYICHLPALRHDSQHNCLSALFLGHWNAVAQTCLFRPATEQYYIAKTDDRQYFLYTTIPMLPTSTCHVKFKPWNTGFHNFTVPHNCSVNTAFFRIETEIEDSMHSTRVRPLNLTPELINVIRAKLPRPNVQALPHHDPHYDDVTHHYVLAAAIAVAVAAILVCLICGYLCYVHCDTKCRPKTNAE